MITEADDFLAETEALYTLLSEHTDGALQEVSAFKGWTFYEIIRHLHVWNQMAFLSLTDKDSFDAAFAQLAAGLGTDAGLRTPEKEYLGELAGAELLQAWHVYALDLAAAFAAADPELRVPWAGPPMSAQSSIVARLMETWSHAQAIYDRLGEERINADRIHSIAELGVRTYRWTFANRGQEAPLPKPHVRLTAPSGATWTWNEERKDECVAGDAVAFARW